jgi:acetyl esterase/lipase
VPIGYLLAVLLVAWAAVFALAPRRPPTSQRSSMSFWFGFLVNELPFVAFLWLLASTLLAAAQGDLGTPVGLVGVAIAGLTTAGLAVIVRRGLQARPAVEHALDEGLAPGWRDVAGPRLGRPPLARILFAPIPIRRRGVRRVANISYGDAGRRNLLDVYHHRSRPSGCPTFVYFHGGAYRGGRKSLEARPLLHRLAAEGWVCVTANYRLSPASSFPDPLVDAKRVIAWVREHAQSYGADGAVLFIAGSSAGGHLASLAALTPNDPRFQPGFEAVDTRVTGAVSLYGYYGAIAGDASVSPHAHLDGAPPFFVAHGDLDTVVIVEDARRFVAELRRRSDEPVVYAELPGGHHVFDGFYSFRSGSVVDGVLAFADCVQARRAD